MTADAILAAAKAEGRLSRVHLAHLGKLPRADAEAAIRQWLASPEGVRDIAASGLRVRHPHMTDDQITRHLLEEAGL